MSSKRMRPRPLARLIHLPRQRRRRCWALFIHVPGIPRADWPRRDFPHQPSPATLDAVLREAGYEPRERSWRWDAVELESGAWTVRAQMRVRAIPRADPYEEDTCP